MISLALWLNSCGSPEVNEQSQVKHLKTLKLQGGEGTLNFSQFIDSIRYVVLETTPQNIIGKIGKLWVTDQRIWVMDKQATRVWVFDPNGNFLFGFCQQGRGPGELRRLNTMIVAEERNRVYLSDPGKSIQVFDTTGKFIEQIQSPFFFKEFEQVGPNCFALWTMIDNTGYTDDSTNLAYNLLLVDSTFQQLQGKYFPYTQGLDDIQAFNRFSSGKGQVLFNYSRYDTLYQIFPTDVSPAWIMDFGEHAFDPAMLADYGPQSIENLTVHDKLTQRGVHHSINRFFHDSKYLILYTGIRNRTRILLRHLPSKKTFYANQWQNDLTGINSVDLVGLFGHELYFVVPAYRLAEMESADAVALSQKVNPRDNPVLMIATLKPFSNQ